jgi:DNA-binding response OmpR family regulator
MPGINGVEVCRQLKQYSATAAVPILVVTAVGHLGTKQAALLSGADDFITKPFRPADLRARVTAMLKVRRIDADLDRALAYLHEVEAIRYAQQRASGARSGVEVRPGQSLAAEAIPVLLVDDEALTREFYGDLLTQHGFQVHTASSGPAGLEVARHQPVETAMLDIVMPGMSGLEVLERLHEEAPDLPLIMLTGRPTAQNAISALKLGAFDFLVKGLHHNLVVLTVHRAVRHRRETRRQQAEFAQLRARIAELEQPRADT